MNEYQRSLRDFQDYADEVTRARYRTFPDAMRRFSSTLVPGTPIGEVASQLPDVGFDAWLEAQVASGGSMVGSASLEWPEDARARLSTQVELMRRLGAEKLDIVDFTTHFMWVRNNFDDNIAEFIQQVFRPFVRDFLRFAHESAVFSRGLQARDAALPERGPMASSLVLFISHSAVDAPVAKALIQLFEKALKISARDIRCTSVDGYRLPAGADSNEVLRTEVFDARLFLALLTPKSLTSAYVLFELGARWGARRPLFPVLARGSSPGDLRAPLSGLNALNGTAVDQVRQLIEDASSALSMRLEPMASFSTEVEAVVLAAQASYDPAEDVTAPEVDERPLPVYSASVLATQKPLSVDETRIMREFGVRDARSFPTPGMPDALGMTNMRFDVARVSLEGRGYVQYFGPGYDSLPTLSVTHQGMKYILESQLGGA